MQVTFSEIKKAYYAQVKMMSNKSCVVYNVLWSLIHLMI